MSDDQVRKVWIVQCHDKFLYDWNGKKPVWTSRFDSARIFPRHPWAGMFPVIGAEYDKVRRVLDDQPCAQLVEVEVRLTAK